MEYQENKRIDAYQHVRNKNCIYRRIGDTDIFQWENFTRSERGIDMEIYYNQKFVVYKEPKEETAK